MKCFFPSKHGLELTKVLVKLHFKGSQWIEFLQIFPVWFEPYRDFFGRQSCFDLYRIPVEFGGCSILKEFQCNQTSVHYARYQIQCGGLHLQLLKGVLG